MSSYSCVTARLTMRSVLAHATRAGGNAQANYMHAHIYDPGALGVESALSWSASQGAEGAGQTTHGNDDKRRPRCRFPALSCAWMAVSQKCRRSQPLALAWRWRARPRRRPGIWPEWRP